MKSSGPMSDVVISCRIRLARNLAGRPFVSKLGPEQAQAVCEEVQNAISALELGAGCHWASMTEASPVLRLLLWERHLISRDLAPIENRGERPPGRAVAFDRSESVSMMVNEEDHLRIQSMATGFDFQGAWERARDIDQALEDNLTFATSDTLGYLTGCPTNVGTGMRASVMLHLPALGMVRKELEKVFTAAQRTGLAVRGMHGEGSRAGGDYYQISNQITLGSSEEQLIEDLRSLVPVIVDFERSLRDALMEGRGAALKDRICRSLGTLRAARAMPTEDAYTHLSNIRLGVNVGILPETSLAALTELGVHVQRGHVQVLSDMSEGEENLIEVSERDRLRASLLRKRLAAT